MGSVMSIMVVTAAVVACMTGPVKIPYPFHDDYVYRFAFWSGFLMTQPVVCFITAFVEAFPCPERRLSFSARCMCWGLPLGIAVGYAGVALTWMERTPMLLTLQ